MSLFGLLRDPILQGPCFPRLFQIEEHSVSDRTVSMSFFSLSSMPSCTWSETLYIRPIIFWLCYVKFCRHHPQLKQLPSPPWYISVCCLNFSEAAWFIWSWDDSSISAVVLIGQCSSSNQWRLVGVPIVVSCLRCFNVKSYVSLIREWRLIWQICTLLLTVS